MLFTDELKPLLSNKKLEVQETVKPKDTTFASLNKDAERNELRPSKIVTDRRLDSADRKRAAETDFGLDIEEFLN